MKPFLIPLLVYSCSASLPAAVFDFGDGNNSANNSQNGGNGNVIRPQGASAFPIAATVDGILLSITPVNTASAEAVTLGSNSQGWGVLTGTESGNASAARRIGGDVGNEAFEFSFDADVRLDALRFGSFGNGEVALLEFVSGTNPFSAGTSTTLAGDGSQGPDVDIPVSGVGTVMAGTVLRLSASAPTGGGFLFNEMAVSDPNAPAGDLATSIVAGLPGLALARNPDPGTGTGATTVAAGDTKGQSFSLPASADLTHFYFQVDSVATGGDFMLDVYRAMDGVPWLLDPIFTDGGTLPDGLADGDIFQIGLPAPLAVERGSYAVTLTGVGGTSFALRFTEQPLFLSGSASRDNSQVAGWQRLNNPAADLVFAVEGNLGAEAPAAPEGAPNLVFILADDLGWTDIQVGAGGPNALDGANYGSDYYQTPNLARLAAGGLSFTHCFAHPNCAPTRSALLSGQYAPRSGNGVYVVDRLNREAGSEQPTTFIPPSQNEDVPAAHITVAEALRAGGYVTAHLGKYHVGNHEGGQATMPENQGFDFNFGGKQDGAPGAYHASGQQFGGRIGPGLDAYAQNYDAAYRADVLAPLANGNDPSGLSGAKHVEDGLGDAAVAFMRDHRAGAMADRPFYLQLHHYAVHTPIGNSQARADLLAKYSALPTGVRHGSAPYAAILENMDHTLGRILNCLEDPDGDGDGSDSIAGNTLVMWTSDNGGHIGPTDNDPMRHRKGSFWNGGIRVPLIVWQPDTVPAGQQTDTLVHSVDFYPTLIGHAGLTMPAGIRFDGTSFAAHIDDPAASPRDRGPVFYHFPGYLDQRARPCEVVLRRVGGEDYKLIYTYDLDYTGNPSSGEDVSEGLDVLDEHWELYRYSRDISETSDLLDGSFANWLLYGDIATTMADELDAWLNQSDPGWNARALRLRATNAVVPFPTAASLPSVRGSFEILSIDVDTADNDVTVSFPGEPGFFYDVEASGDLQTWVAIATDIGGVGDPTTAADIPDAGIAAGGQRYYRIVLHD